MRRNARAADVATAALAENVVQLLRIDPQLRLEPQADAVHDARVCVRRLRSHLKTFAPVLETAWADDLRERLRWLSDALSGARDADVLLADVTARGATLPGGDRRRLDDVLGPLRECRSAAYDALAQALRAPRYIALIDDLVSAAKEPRLARAARRRARKLLPELMAPVWRRLRKQARRAERGGHDHDLHRLRIKAKHARYAAEALVPVAGPRATRFAACAEALQALLGKQHDAVNARHALRRHLATPDAAFVAGEITAAEQAAAEHHRGAWRACWKRVVRTKRERGFWK